MTSVNDILRRARESTRKRSRWLSIICCDDEENRQDTARDLYDQAAARSLALRDLNLAGDIALEMVRMLPSLAVSEQIHWLQEAANMHIRSLRKKRSMDALDIGINTTNKVVEVLIANNYDAKAAQVYENLHDAWPSMPSDVAEDLLTKAVNLTKSDDFNLIIRVRIGQKHATLMGRLKKYKEAAVEFEELATAVQNDNFQKYSVRHFVLRAGLCRLANGETILPDYAKLFPILYDTTTELLIICELLECSEVAAVTTKYKSYLQGDPWIIDLLLDIKRHKENLLVNGNDDSIL